MKKDRKNISRRSFLNTSTALSFAAIPGIGLATPFIPEIKTKESATLSSSKGEIFKSHIRLMGSLKPATIYNWFSGHLWGILPGEAPKPLTTLQGLAKSNWKKEGNNYTKESFDLGFFGDLETGKVLDTWKNPYTNEIIEPFHFMYGGGSNTTYTPDGILSGETIKPYKENWVQSGEQIWLDEYGSASFKNPLQPEEWPISSAGEQMHFGSSTTYVTDAKQLFNPNIDSCEQTFFWTAINSWEPWLHMGQKPGFVMWRATGKKIVDISEIPDSMHDYVSKVQPNYFDNEQPWKGRRSTYTSYKEERKNNEK
ncbi:uncharacterized protein DUF1838 [Maribacter vaceletii]|uniref:Uncharacterized protein DUF1838 n=1 Tax=Maribacter vaceletii TaxID=1206816 RepID=A0A495EEP6_9FLAO|nr:DUF1838 family protein [Maribacter vaceletii]RKR15236.1 uncharacterized protein DUF1838 [Maribacter vaceletii]